MAIEAGADALGLVARMPSGPGPISDAMIATVAAIVPPPVATFLLTSETTAAAISAHIRATNPSTVQIVSHIDPAESAKLAVLERNVRRVQVIHVEGPEAIDLIPAYAPHIHAFLLDSGRPNATVAELGERDERMTGRSARRSFRQRKSRCSLRVACPPRTSPTRCGAFGLMV